MKFKVGAIALALLLAVAASYTSLAGALADNDSDLVPDGFDNCLTTANGPAGPSDQVDTDQDGYGNACDADYDNDGTVTQLDFGTLGNTFGKTVGNPGYNAAVDCDGDNTITQLDFGCLGTAFGGPPGPSGLSCAGTIACP